MTRSTTVVAGCLLALALAGCGRYGAPIRAPRPAAAAAAPAPAPGAPADQPAEESTEP